jgi:hypothetical protein
MHAFSDGTALLETPLSVFRNKRRPQLCLKNHSRHINPGRVTKYAGPLIAAQPAAAVSSFCRWILIPARVAAGAFEVC